MATDGHLVTTRNTIRGPAANPQLIRASIDKEFEKQCVGGDDDYGINRGGCSERLL